MNVFDIMTASPATVAPEATLREALELMEEVGCRHLPVLSYHKHLVGILSDRDCRTALHSPYVLRAWWESDELARTLTVNTIMSPAPIVAEPSMPADEAARLMLQNHISCLPVMRSETLVGIVTTSDVLAAFIRLSRRTEQFNP